MGDDVDREGALLRLPMGADSLLHAAAAATACGGDSYADNQGCCRNEYACQAESCCRAAMLHCDYLNCQLWPLPHRPSWGEIFLADMTVTGVDAAQ